MKQNVFSKFIQALDKFERAAKRTKVIPRSGNVKSVTNGVNAMDTSNHYKDGKLEENSVEEGRFIQEGVLNPLQESSKSNTSTRERNEVL